MSMISSVAAFLDNLCRENGEGVPVSLTTMRAILKFVEDEFGVEARIYIRSCFDADDEIDGRKAFFCHTLPGEALQDWIQRPNQLTRPTCGGRQ